jgi:serine/threonine protein kinase
MKKIEIDPKGIIRKTQTSNVFHGIMTYQGRDHHVAVKNIRRHDIYNNEAGVHSSLSHPNIVDLMHAEPRKKQIVSTYVHGMSVESIIKEHGAIALEDTVDILFDTASALEYMHDRETGSFVHFDVKPGNIMLDLSSPDAKRFRTFLIDFGISYALDNVPGFFENVIVGTAGYLGPERCSDRFELGQKDDMYGFGATGYHMITGSMPYEHLDNIGMVRATIQGASIKRLHTRSRNFNHLVMSCLDPNHRNRPSASEARSALQNIRKSL